MPKELNARAREARNARVSVSLTQQDKELLDQRAREAGVATGLLASLAIKAYLAAPDILPDIPASSR